VQILDFIKSNGLVSKTQLEQAKLLSYYHHKENGESTFTMTSISDLMLNAGFNSPNTSRLKESMTKGNRGKGKVFLESKTRKGAFEFIPTVLQDLDLSVGQAWCDTATIISDSELIDEIKFCGKRHFLTNLIQQINSSYKNNCYDAAAVLMRRLFEILLILSYRNLQIDGEIKNDGTNMMLKDIVKNAIQNKTLNLSRIKTDFDKFRDVGNYSAHSIEYTAGKKDIDDIKHKYRVMLEELYNKAGLM
jgi:hypothetical protein